MEESARKTKEIDELKLQRDGLAVDPPAGKPAVDKMLDLERQYARAIDDRAALEAEVAELKAKLSHRQVKVCHMHPPAQAHQAQPGQPQDSEVVCGQREVAYKAKI